MDSQSPIPSPPSGNPSTERPVQRIGYPNPAPANQNPTMGVGDIYYVLFRHKWKIFLCSLLGLIAAAVFYQYSAPSYISEAKLFVRYVVTEDKTPGPNGGADNLKSPDLRGETIMDSEKQIITSFDLSEKVAKSIGPARILANQGGENDPVKAAMAVYQGLTVNAGRGSSVIQITFRSPDPTIVQPVLAEVISRYLKTHIEIHRAVGIIGDFLTQETDQLRTRLAQTENDLRKARNKAGVISVADAKKEYSNQLAHIHDEMLNAQADLAERTAILNELAKEYQDKPAPAAKPEKSDLIPPDKTIEYRGVLSRLKLLRNREQELRTQFTQENSRVINIRSQLTEAEGAKQKLEQEFPGLTHTSKLPTANRPAGTLDLPTEYARLTALQAKIKVLNAQQEQIRAEAAGVDQMEGAISELLRKKELEEANYRYYAARLEQSRINEALGTGRVSNISQIQVPSPPVRETNKTLKTVGGISVGGIALGLAWAFAIEMILDRTVRRPVDFERMLGLRLFLTIPAQRIKKLKRKLKELSVANELTPTDAQTALAAAPATLRATPSREELIRTLVNPQLQPFHETLRDRLIGYFDSRNLNHKPKLLAVTGLDEGSGVTTIASGLARSLSETGDGNVLLVDMTVGQESAQQLYRGKTVSSLEELLLMTDGARVQENLYVVAEEPGGNRITSILPHRFNKLVPQLKTSNFDYIIFDMPPVSEISITPRLASFMDMVLLVIESEKTDREMVQRATALLTQSKTPVGAVLNKSQTYVPRSFHQDHLGHI